MATWTDLNGTRRQGELLDTVTVVNPKLGQVAAALYRIAERPPYNAEKICLELTVNGKTHQCTLANLADGHARMAQLRAQA